MDLARDSDGVMPIGREEMLLSERIESSKRSGYLAEACRRGLFSEIG